MARGISRKKSVKVSLALLYICHALAYSATASKLPLEPSWLRLRGWMETRGVSGTDGIAVGVVNAASGLRGVIARKAFAQGDEVLSVPLDCILSESWADTSPIREVYDNITKGNPEQIPACVRVALLLLWLQHSEPEEWAPYFSMLPMHESFTGGGGEPLELWSPGEVHACGCPILEAQVAADRDALRYIYDEVGFGGSLVTTLFQLFQSVCVLMYIRVLFICEGRRTWLGSCICRASQWCTRAIIRRLPAGSCDGKFASVRRRRTILT